MRHGRGSGDDEVEVCRFLSDVTQAPVSRVVSESPWGTGEGSRVVLCGEGMVRGNCRGFGVK